MRKCVREICKAHILKAQNSALTKWKGIFHFIQKQIQQKQMDVDYQLEEKNRLSSFVSINPTIAKYRASSTAEDTYKLQKRAGSESARIPVMFLRHGTRGKNLIWLKPLSYFVRRDLPVVFLRFTLPESFRDYYKHRAQQVGTQNPREIVHLEILSASDVSGKILDIESRGVHIPRARRSQITCVVFIPF